MNVSFLMNLKNTLKNRGQWVMLLIVAAGLITLWGIKEIMSQNNALTFEDITTIQNTQGRVFMQVKPLSILTEPPYALEPGLFADVTPWFANGQYETFPLNDEKFDQYFFDWLGHQPAAMLRKWPLQPLQASDNALLLEIADDAVFERGDEKEVPVGFAGRERSRWYKDNQRKNRLTLREKRPDLRQRVVYAGTSYFDGKSMRPVDRCYLYVQVNKMPYLAQFERWGDTGEVRAGYNDYAKKNLPDNTKTLSGEQEPEHAKIFARFEQH